MKSLGGDFTFPDLLGDNLAYDNYLDSDSSVRKNYRLSDRELLFVTGVLRKAICRKLNIKCGLTWIEVQLMKKLKPKTELEKKVRKELTARAPDNVEDLVQRGLTQIQEKLAAGIQRPEWMAKYTRRVGVNLAIDYIRECNVSQGRPARPERDDTTIDVQPGPVVWIVRNKRPVCEPSPRVEPWM